MIPVVFTDRSNVSLVTEHMVPMSKLRTAVGCLQALRDTSKTKLYSVNQESLTMGLRGLTQACEGLEAFKKLLEKWDKHCAALQALTDQVMAMERRVNFGN